MAKERQSEAPGEAVEETLPQWQPPAGATRSIAIAPPAEPVPSPAPVPAAPASGQQPVATSGVIATPSVSGTRLSAHAEVQPENARAIGLEHTLQAGPVSIAPPKSLEPGDIIVDRYVIEEHISSGGFGAVYRASDRQIRHHQVAIKLLHLPAVDDVARQSALRELMLIASVSHPSVVQFKDYGWFEGRLWFAMPWYRGETLDARYRDNDGRMPIGRAAARPIFERLARGLAAMHEVGIHHHDIKPENIFVADIAGFDGGLPVLLDLGIAATRGEGPKGLTVEYASPEVAAAALGNRERPIGAAADVFSLALVLRNLLEPETAPPSQGELLPMLHKRSTERVELPSSRDLRYLTPAFERWLSLDPDERPTAAELAAEFAILTEPEERREARKRLLRKIIPIVIAAAAAVAVLAYQVSQQKTEITVQRKQITQQMQQSEQLSQQMQQSEHQRKQTADQLTLLEDKSEQIIGEQGKKLQKAIEIARSLDNQLGNSTRRVRRLTEERETLTTERDMLTRERDELQRTRERLQRERDGLEGERDGLLRVRDGLTAERDALARERSRLENERNGLLAQRNELIQKRDRLQAELAGTQRRLDATAAERDGLRDSFDAARDELKDLRQKTRDLEAERRRLDAANKLLEAQVRALKQRTATIQSATPAPSAAPGERARLRNP